MEKLPAYIMVIALLVMNIASAAHADCVENTLCGGIQAVMSIDDAGDHDKEQQNTFCDCCATCGGHHHSHAYISYSKAEQYAASSKLYHNLGGDTYLSQLNYPPSKPPKA